MGKFTKTPAKVFAYQKTEEDSVAAYAQRLKKSSTLTASTIDSAYNADS